MLYDVLLLLFINFKDFIYTNYLRHFRNNLHVIFRIRTSMGADELSDLHFPVA